MPAAVHVIGTGSTLVVLARGSWLVLSRLDRDDGPAEQGPGPAGPAYRPYPRDQIFRDLWEVAQLSGWRAWREIAQLHRRFWTWFRHASPPMVLISLPMAAGLAVVATRTRMGTARFGSIDQMVQTEVESTPLIERITGEGGAAIPVEADVSRAADARRILDEIARYEALQADSVRRVRP